MQVRFSEAIADHDQNVAYMIDSLRSEFPWPSLSTNISRRVQVKSHVGAMAEEGDKKHNCVGPAADEDADEGSGSEVVDVGSGLGDDGDHDACSPPRTVLFLRILFLLLRFANGRHGGQAACRIASRIRGRVKC